MIKPTEDDLAVIHGEKPTIEGLIMFDGYVKRSVSDLLDIITLPGMISEVLEEGDKLIERYADQDYFELGYLECHAGSTVLKRVAAAAGIHMARNPTEPDVVNRIAEDHGLSHLKQEDRELYYLYNLGLDFELDDHQFMPKVMALLAWRWLHHGIPFEKGGEEIDEPLCDDLLEALQAGGAYLKGEGSDEDVRRVEAEGMRPSLDLLKNKKDPLTSKVTQLKLDEQPTS